MLKLHMCWRIGGSHDACANTMKMSAQDSVLPVAGILVLVSYEFPCQSARLTSKL